MSAPHSLRSTTTSRARGRLPRMRACSLSPHRHHSTELGSPLLGSNLSVPIVTVICISVPPTRSLNTPLSPSSWSSKSIKSLVALKAPEKAAGHKGGRKLRLAELVDRVHDECRRGQCAGVRGFFGVGRLIHLSLAAVYKGRGATRSPPFIDRDSCLASSGRSLSFRRKRKRKRQESHHRSRPG